MKITKKAAKKKLEELLAKATDARTRRRVQAEVARSLKQGQDSLRRLQKAVQDPANRAKAAE